MLPNIVTCIARMFEYEQTKPRTQKQSPYDRLLVARDTAFMMILVLSQIPVQQRAFDGDDSALIVRNCIIPRIQKMLTSAERYRHLRPRLCLLHPNNSIFEGKYQSQVAHIELMIYLVKNPLSFTDEFVLTVSSKACEKFLREYREATCDMLDDRNGVDAFIGALEKAVKRAHALPEPDPEKAQLSDAFSVRNIYDDPDVKALIDSERFTPEKRLELQNAVEDLLLQQPIFPPNCYAIQRV
ncbi:hypothetical protein M407DRAFT_30841 [Tulasnella calospora MUT 4182]|uniref:Uncharacterized protein n=1 Tax=Tulasnella calospora MUT 4182 TaxID=1051891 RepID=A0A0C3Q6P4_9AGAM|nr:hypothetical protein M407DRAFT_30841 [Tulasnella calospora MUT 4182]